MIVWNNNTCFKLVHICLNLFKKDKTCQKCFKLVQIGSRLLKMDQNRPIWFRLAQISPKLCELVQTCPNAKKIKILENQHCESVACNCSAMNSVNFKHQRHPFIWFIMTCRKNHSETYLEWKRFFVEINSVIFPISLFDLTSKPSKSKHFKSSIKLMIKILSASHTSYP